MNLATPYNEAHRALLSMGWELQSIKQKNGLWVAKGSGPSDVEGERIGQSPELALAALVMFAQRHNKIRSFAAAEKVAAWSHDFTPKREEIARAYAKLPAFEAKAVPAWRALADESRKQADAIRKQIKVEHTEEPEPYLSHHEMREDIHHKKRYKATRANADHPVWTPEEVVNFRIVHDVIGHGGGNSDYSWDGENKAAANHFPHLTPLAREALFVETVGRSAYDNTYHGHGPKKVALMSDFLKDAHANEGDHITIPHGATPDTQQAVDHIMGQMPDGGYVEPTRQARDLFTSLAQKGTKIREAHAATIAYLGMHSIPEDDCLRLADNILEDFALAAAQQERVAAWTKVGDWIKEAANPTDVYMKLLKRPDIMSSQPLQALLKEFVGSHSGQKVMGNYRYMEWFVGRIKRMMKGGGELPPNHALLEDAIRIFDMLEESKRRNIPAPDIFKMEYEEARRWANDVSRQFYEQDNRWQDKQVVYRFNGENKGWTIDRLSAQPDFNTEGRLMGHCVGGTYYWGRHTHGQTDVFSLRDPQGNPHATIELLKQRYNGDHGGFSEKGGGSPSGTGTEQYAADDPEGDKYVVLQAFGKSDQPPTEKYRKMLGQWFQAWGITEESPRKTENNWADDSNGGCNGGYGAHDGYEYWDGMDGMPPEKITNVQTLYDFEATMDQYHGHTGPFTDFETECPYSDMGEGPGGGYFDLKHREDYGLHDDYRGFEGPTCEGMEVYGLEFPDVDWESLFQDIMQTDPTQDKRIADDIATYFHTDANIQYEKSWTNKGQPIKAAMGSFAQAIEDEMNAWQVAPEHEQPHDQFERLKSIYDMVAAKLPELKAEQQRYYDDRHKYEQEHGIEPIEGQADSLGNWAKNEEYEGYPTFGTRWSLPAEGQGQMFGDMWIPYDDDAAPEQKLFEALPEYAQDEAEKLIKAVQNGQRDDVHPGHQKDTNGFRRALYKALQRRIFREFNIRIPDGSFGYGTSSNEYSEAATQATDAAMQWLQQNPDLLPVRQHALDAWRQEVTNPEHEDWDWMHNPLEVDRHVNKRVNTEFPHLFEQAVPQVGYPEHGHGTPAVPGPAQNVLDQLRDTYDIPPGVEIPEELLQQLRELQSNPDKYKVKIPNPFHEGAANRERDPDYRFVYYNTGLSIEPWHHNLRYRDLRKKLLNHFGIDETNFIDDDHNEWASGDVWKDPDDSYQIELKNLASEDVQLAAITAVHDWLDDA